MNNRISTWLRWVILLSLAVVETPTLASAKTFSDTTFNLADYTRSTFQTGGGTVNVSQTTTGGNPGSAVVVTTDAPATFASFAAAVYFVRNSFSWNPASDGNLVSVNWNEDVYLTNTPGATTAVGGDIFIFQSGNYYLNIQLLPTNTGVFQTATATNLTASDFSLITDLPTANTNSGVHPNFTAPLVFGLVSTAFRGSANSDHTVVKVDNLTIHAISEFSAADFNGDNKVSAADYVYWRDFYGDAPRYALWRKYFGGTIAPGLGSGETINAIPEPANCYLAILALSAIAVPRSTVRHRSRPRFQPHRG
jgi:hypothetical protein